MNRKIQDDEIDLLELAQAIWTKRVMIFKISGVFVILGLIVALASKVEYEASAKLLPESQESSIPDIGGIGGLAGLAGFDLSSFGGSSEVISPELFPEIINSEPFLNQLINSPVYFEKLDKSITCFEYFKEVDSPSLFELMAEYTIGLPSKIKSIFKDENESQDNKTDLKRYTKEDWKIFENFAERLSVDVEKDTGIILVDAEIPDAVAAAQVTKRMVELLTEYVTNYKIEKAQSNLNFVVKQFEEAEKVYNTKQANVARFTDRNRNLTTSLSQVEYRRLQNEMEIAFEVYKGLANQLEQAKIKVNEKIPVFTVLEPVRIPEDKSAPRRGMILALSLFLSFLITVLSIVLRYLFSKSK